MPRRRGLGDIIVPTIREVAENAGVSASTASRVLAGGDKRSLYSPDTVVRVERAAQTLGYRVNYHMRSVRTGRSYAIGFSMDAGRQEKSGQVGSWYFEQLREGIEARAQDAKMNVLIVRPDGRRSASARGLDYVKDRRIDALIVPQGYARRMPEAAKIDPALPIVTVDGVAGVGLSHVGFDEQVGQRLIVERLARLGHRQAVWFGPSFTGESPSSGREQRFLREAFAAGLTGQLCVIPEITDAGRADVASALADAEHQFHQWLIESKPAGVTAVIGYSDLFAIAAQRALGRAGRRVPRDVSVIGFDDAFASFGDPPLTTVSHELFEMGQQACDLALRRVEAQSRGNGNGDDKTAVVAEPELRMVEPKLIVRQSCGPAPGAATAAT